jgi:hypothetical protein
MKAKPTPTFSWEEIDALRVAAGCAREERRTGGCTIDEYAERYKVPRSTAQFQLSGLVRSGALVCRSESALDSLGRSVTLRVFYPAREGAICGGSTPAGSKKRTGRKRA